MVDDFGWLETTVALPGFACFRLGLLSALLADLPLRAPARAWRVIPFAHRWEVFPGTSVGFLRPLLLVLVLLALPFARRAFCSLCWASGRQLAPRCGSTVVCFASVFCQFIGRCLPAPGFR